MTWLLAPPMLRDYQFADTTSTRVANRIIDNTLNEAKRFNPQSRQKLTRYGTEERFRRSCKFTHQGTSLTSEGSTPISVKLITILRLNATVCAHFNTDCCYSCCAGLKMCWRNDNYFGIWSLTVKGVIVTSIYGLKLDVVLKQLCR